MARTNKEVLDSILDKLEYLEHKLDNFENKLDNIINVRDQFNSDLAKAVDKFSNDMKHPDMGKC